MCYAVCDKILHVRSSELNYDRHLNLFIPGDITHQTYKHIYRKILLKITSVTSIIHNNFNGRT